LPASGDRFERVIRIIDAVDRLYLLLPSPGALAAETAALVGDSAAVTLAQLDGDERALLGAVTDLDRLTPRELVAWRSACDLFKETVAGLALQPFAPPALPAPPGEPGEPPPPPTGPAAEPRATRRTWAALAAVCLGVVLVVADNTIVNVALPTLSRELDPLELLARPAFFGPVVVLTLATLTLFGFVFVATQYLQVVLGLGTFASGLRYLPFAVAMIVTAVRSPKLVGSLGAARVVSAGMVAVAVAMLATLGLGARPGAATSALVLALVTVLGVGMGLVTAPATDLLMHAVPPGRAGIGSGMNDAARQVGGAFGVAVMGATFSAGYGSTLRGSATLAGLDDSMMERLVHSPGMALVAGAAGPPELVVAVQEAFVTGMHRAALVGAVAALLGSAATWRLFR
jgi:MFS family permease